MAIGDALAVSLLERRDFRHDDFAALHPAGSLGKRLLRVDKVMHAGDALPKISPQTPMPDLHEMSAKKLGMTTIVNADGTLAGILTDGDLRRLMEKHGGATLGMTAAQCLNPNPQTVKRASSPAKRSPSWKAPHHIGRRHRRFAPRPRRRPPPRSLGLQLV